MTDLNTSKTIDFQYRTQFYDIDGQVPIDASAQVDTHTSLSPRSHSGRCDDTKCDEQHSVGLNLGWLEQPRCTIPRQGE